MKSIFDRARGSKVVSFGVPQVLLRAIVLVVPWLANVEQMVSGTALKLYPPVAVIVLWVTYKYFLNDAECDQIDSVISTYFIKALFFIYLVSIAGIGAFLYWQMYVTLFLFLASIGFATLLIFGSKGNNDTRTRIQIEIRATALSTKLSDAEKEIGDLQRKVADAKNEHEAEVNRDYTGLEYRIVDTSTVWKFLNSKQIFFEVTEVVRVTTQKNFFTFKRWTRWFAGELPTPDLVEVFLVEKDSKSFKEGEQIDNRAVISCIEYNTISYSID